MFLTHVEMIAKRKEFKDKIVVYTNGCFDLLHFGHLNSLREAKKQGDILIVGMNTDRSIRFLKGDSRPIICQDQRVSIVDELKCVDYTCVFDQRTSEVLIALLQPDIYCKGYRAEPESTLVESYGGKVVEIPHLVMISTSEIITRIQKL